MGITFIELDPFSGSPLTTDILAVSAPAGSEPDKAYKITIAAFTEAVLATGTFPATFVSVTVVDEGEQTTSLGMSITGNSMAMSSVDWDNMSIGDTVFYEGTEETVVLAKPSISFADVTPTPDTTGTVPWTYRKAFYCSHISGAAPDHNSLIDSEGALVSESKSVFVKGNTFTLGDMTVGGNIAGALDASFDGATTTDTVNTDHIAANQETIITVDSPLKVATGVEINSGTVTFSNSAELAGTVGGEIDLDTLLTVTGSAKLAGTTIDGGTGLAPVEDNTLTIKGHVLCAPFLYVSGTVAPTDNPVILGNFQVNSTVTGEVEGTGLLMNNLKLSGILACPTATDVNITGRINLGSTTINGTTVNFTSTVSAGGSVHAGGAVTATTLMTCDSNIESSGGDIVADTGDIEATIGSLRSVGADVSSVLKVKQIQEYVPTEGVRFNSDLSLFGNDILAVGTAHANHTETGTLTVLSNSVANDSQTSPVTRTANITNLSGSQTAISLDDDGMVSMPTQPHLFVESVNTRTSGSTSHAYWSTIVSQNNFAFSPNDTDVIFPETGIYFATWTCSWEPTIWNSNISNNISVVIAGKYFNSSWPTVKDESTLGASKGRGGSYIGHITQGQSAYMVPVQGQGVPVDSIEMRMSFYMLSKTIT